MKVGILSDTHSSISPKVLDFFANCDQIWHAGDIGNERVCAQLNEIAPLKAVYGNIDDFNIRIRFPEYQLFSVEKVKVMMTHIGGYPKKYSFGVLPKIELERPNLFITGHSHILKVMFDSDFEMLYINPGAAGKYGFHLVSTAVRLDINADKFENLEILEIEK